MDYWTLKKKAIMGSMQSGKVTEAEGYPLNLENAIKGNMKAYKIWGNKKGKNLCPLSTFVATGGVTNKQTIYPKSAGAVRYTISMRVAEMDNPVSDSTVIAINFYFKNGSFSGHNIQLYQLQVGKVISIKPKIVSEIKYFTIAKYYTLTSGTVVFDNIQLEEGTEATEYEPYQENDGLGAFGNVDVVSSGKNLLKATDVYKGASNYQELTEDGRNCIRFIDNVTYKYYYSFKENTQYTVSFDCKTTIKSTTNRDGGHAFKFYYTDGTSSNIFVNREMPWTHKTLTSTAGKTVACIGLTSYTWVNWNYIDIDTFQIEEGTEATPYEAVREPTTTTINLTGHSSIMPNEYIDYKNGCIVRSDGTEEDIILPKIPLHKGYNIITASDAELEATKMYGKYLKKG